MLTSGSITENGGSELQDGLRRTDKHQLLKAVTYRDGPFDLVGGGGGKEWFSSKGFFLVNPRQKYLFSAFPYIYLLELFSVQILFSRLGRSCNYLF